MLLKSTDNTYSKDILSLTAILNKQKDIYEDKNHVGII